MYGKFILLYVCVEIRRSCKILHDRDQHYFTVKGLLALILVISL